MNKEWIRTLKFTLFSMSAGIIQIISDALAQEVFKWEPEWAYLFALVLSVLWNFTLNRKFTFHSAANVPIAMLKIAAYYAVFAPLSTWWTKELTNIGWNSYLVLALTMLSNLVTEFLVQRFWVFGKSIDTDKKSAE